MHNPHRQVGIMHFSVTAWQEDCLAGFLLNFCLGM